MDRVARRLKDGSSDGHGGYLRITDEGYLELRMYVGMNRDKWCKEIGGPLLSQPYSFQEASCALLTGVPCGVFLKQKQGMDAKEQGKVEDYHARVGSKTAKS